MGCTQAPRPPSLGDAPSSSELLEALARAPAGDIYTASLFLEFEGGFLEQDRLKINGEIALEWPDRVRVIGAYGAFKKVFDLLVISDRFELFDNEEGVLFRGSAFDNAAAAALGFAVRPGDIARLLRIDGTGPLEGTTVEHVSTSADTVRVVFRVTGDRARWTAIFDAETLELRTVRREDGAGDGVEARYDGHFRTGGRRVPRRVKVHRLGGDERVEIEVRAIRFRDRIDADVFEAGTRDGAEIVDL